jgi:hypothetical protein
MVVAAYKARIAELGAPPPRFGVVDVPERHTSNAESERA